MMAQVYIDAARESRKGTPWYVLNKGGYTVRVTKGQSLLALLKDNYRIQVKYVNGVGEYTYELNAPTDIRIINQISCIVFGKKGILPFTRVYVNVQEHLDTQGVDRECLWMYFTNWDNGKMRTMWVTPKDELADQEAFRKGQSQAEAIMDLLITHGIRQNPARLIWELETELLISSQKEFTDDVLNAVHNAILDGEYSTWEDLCVELPVPEVIAPGYEFVVWGEDNDAEERFYSIWCYWNNRKDWFTIYSNSSADADLIAALEAAILRMKAQTK